MHGQLGVHICKYYCTTVKRASTMFYQDYFDVWWGDVNKIDISSIAHFQAPSVISYKHLYFQILTWRRRVHLKRYQMVVTFAKRKFPFFTGKIFQIFSCFLSTNKINQNNELLFGGIISGGFSVTYTNCNTSTRYVHFQFKDRVFLINVALSVKLNY